MPGATTPREPVAVEAEPLAGAPHVARLRIRLADGAATTAHLARHPREAVEVRIVHLDPAVPVADWAQEHGCMEATSGGFFAKPEIVPLGVLHAHDGPAPFNRFRDPWHGVRACLVLRSAGPAIVSGPCPEDVPALQAGPLLVAGGEVVVAAEDPEGFASTAEHEFDQDLTAERLPRMALGLSAGDWLALAVDGRGPDDAGLHLDELAALLAHLGATDAMNLDGGSSSALVAGGRLRNTPRDDEGNELEAAGETTSAIVFAPRRRPPAQSSP